MDTHELKTCCTLVEIGSFEEDENITTDANSSYLTPQANIKEELYKILSSHFSGKYPNKKYGGAIAVTSSHQKITADLLEKAGFVKQFSYKGDSTCTVWLIRAAAWTRKNSRKVSKRR